jgi:hypothetical protein
MLRCLGRVEVTAAVPRWLSARGRLCQPVEEVAISGAEAKDSGGEFARQGGVPGVWPSLAWGRVGL